MAITAHRILEHALPDILKDLKNALRAITKADEKSESEANKIASKLDLTLLEQFGTTAFLSVLDTVATDSGREFAVEIGIPTNSPMFGQIHQRAADFMRARGAELVKDIDGATRNDIAYIIADGLENKLTPEQIAAKLEDAYAFSRERALLIANTEIGIANSMGTLAGMYELQASGVTIKKKWLPDALACDICVENGLAGAIPLDEEFPSGDQAPLAHPNCRCDLASVIED